MNFFNEPKYSMQAVPDISSLGERVRSLDVSPVELVTACLERIEHLNPQINAFITVLADQAIARAREIEEEIRSGGWRGPLHGIPIAIKDFYDTAGTKTTAAFEHFQNRVPAKDAVGVARLKKAGAIILGKTNMHSLGMGTTGLESFFGPVRNPCSAEHIPGGSSSGSAAAVATGMCYATLDTDAIGSCRLPAACCGVVGFKATYGLISSEGILAGEKDPGEFIRWFSHPGITTRSVTDTAIVLDVLAERSGPSFVSDLAGSARRTELRVGVASNFKGDEEISAALDRAVAVIRKLGYSMMRIEAPFLTPPEGVKTIEADRKAIAGRAFQDIDVILLPTTTTVVPSIQESGADPQALSPENTIFANYYGLPAISVPCGFDRHGLPMGLQMASRPGGEAFVLSLGRDYESATAGGAREDRA